MTKNTKTAQLHCLQVLSHYASVFVS